MTLKFIDGFEGYTDIDDLTKVFLGSTDSSGYFSFPTGRRAGTKCLNWNSSGGSSGLLKIPIANGAFIADEEVIFGFSFKVSAYGLSYKVEFDFVSSGQGGVRLQFVNGGNIIKLYRSHIAFYEVGSFNYEVDTWYYIEVKCKIAKPGGYIIAHLNEQEVLNYTGDTMWSGATSFSRVEGRFGDNWNILIDDFYIAGSEGVNNNDFLGDVRIDSINPNGAGNYTDLTPSAGSNYQCVDEVVIDESDYVEGIDPGDKDSYSYPDVPTDLDDADIKGIFLRNISQRTAPADNIKIDSFIRTGSTDYNASADLSLQDVWASKDFIFEKDPSDSGDWTKAKINACEFGMEVA
jgi:hypothetical protein